MRPHCCIFCTLYISLVPILKHLQTFRTINLSNYCEILRNLLRPARNHREDHEKKSPSTHMIVPWPLHLFCPDVLPLTGWEYMSAHWLLNYFVSPVFTFPAPPPSLRHNSASIIVRSEKAFPWNTCTPLPIAVQVNPIKYKGHVKHTQSLTTRKISKILHVHLSMPFSLKFSFHFLTHVLFMHKTTLHVCPAIINELASDFYAVCVECRITVCICQSVTLRHRH